MRIAPAELCLPVKAFLGHVRSLVGEVDALFLPRIVCRRARKELLFGCPKALALPDLVRALFPSLPQVVELNLDERLESEARAFGRAAKTLGCGPAAGRRAYQRARTSYRQLAPDGMMACSPSLAWTAVVAPGHGRPVRIRVVGHPYVLYDRTLSLGLLDKLGQIGAEPAVVHGAGGWPADAARPEFLPNWVHEVPLIHGALNPAGREPYDGVLLASSFACGTSAVTNEIIRHAVGARWPSLPILTLMLDEHTAEAGLLTRIESFVELIRLRGRR